MAAVCPSAASAPPLTCRLADRDKRDVRTTGSAGATPQVREPGVSHGMQKRRARREPTMEPSSAFREHWAECTSGESAVLTAIRKLSVSQHHMHKGLIGGQALVARCCFSGPQGPLMHFYRGAPHLAAVAANVPQHATPNQTVWVGAPGVILNGQEQVNAPHPETWPPFGSTRHNTIRPNLNHQQRPNNSEGRLLMALRYAESKRSSLGRPSPVEIPFPR